METEAARQLQAARESGQPSFTTSPTRVESTGLVIPPIRTEVDGHTWRLEQDWSYRTADCRITVPRGWETNLASVPWPIRRVLNSFEFGITGPLLHDFIYEHGGCLPRGSCEPWRPFRRAEADALLLELMRAERVPAWRRALGYAFTRVLGWTHWEDPPPPSRSSSQR